MTKREAMIEILTGFGVDPEFIEEVISMTEREYPSIALPREMNPIAMEHLKNRLSTIASIMTTLSKTPEGREEFKNNLRRTIQKASVKMQKN